MWLVAYLLASPFRINTERHKNILFFAWDSSLASKVSACLYSSCVGRIFAAIMITLHGTVIVTRYVKSSRSYSKEKRLALRFKILQFFQVHQHPQGYTHTASKFWETVFCSSKKIYKCNFHRKLCISKLWHCSTLQVQKRLVLRFYNFWSSSRTQAHPQGCYYKGFSASVIRFIKTKNGSP